MKRVTKTGCKKLLSSQRIQSSPSLSCLLPFHLSLCTILISPIYEVLGTSWFSLGVSQAPASAAGACLGRVLLGAEGQQ